MPLLEIKPTKKINVLCSLEESTALLVNQYAAFAKAPGDDVVNKAIEYAFSKDAEFQKFRNSILQRPSLCAQRSLRLRLRLGGADPSLQPLQRIDCEWCVALRNAPLGIAPTRQFAVRTELVS